MKTIRRGVFETNSSSTHSVTILSIEEFNKWKEGNLYINRYDFEDIYTKEELFEKLREEYAEYQDYSDEDLLEAIKDDRGFQTYDDYFDDRYLETDVNEYITKSGDKIVIICKYGNDW